MVTHLLDVGAEHSVDPRLIPASLLPEIVEHVLIDADFGRR